MMSDLNIYAVQISVVSSQHYKIHLKPFIAILLPKHNWYCIYTVDFQWTSRIFFFICGTQEFINFKYIIFYVSCSPKTHKQNGGEIEVFNFCPKNIKNTYFSNNLCIFDPPYQKDHDICFHIFWLRNFETERFGSNYCRVKQTSWTELGHAQ